ncbi:MAG: hypothetical protein AB8B78_01130 [Polaribacter sp.]
MHYYLVIALQVYCIYHAYKNKSDNYWFFVIFFIPLIGCIIYIITQVINRNDVAAISEEITTIINPTKKIKDLQQQLEFSNTFQNKINLADAFLENKDFENAILYFEKAREGNFKNDPYTLNKLIICYFKTTNFDKVISYSSIINLDKDFKDTVYFYGLALEKKGELKEAELQLKKIDKRFSNYDERLELSNFYLRIDKKQKAKEVLSEIISEINSMTKSNSRKYRYIILEAEKKLNGI